MKTYEEFKKMNEAKWSFGEISKLVITPFNKWLKRKHPNSKYVIVNYKYDQNKKPDYKIEVDKINDKDFMQAKSFVTYKFDKSMIEFYYEEYFVYDITQSSPKELVSGYYEDFEDDINDMFNDIEEDLKLK